ncbi:MAG: VWA domain-containing protein, partial [Verrucomicrobiae bacterium]
METLALTFGSPQWLWGLLAAPLFAFLYVWSHLRGRALLERVVAPRLLERLAGSVSAARRAVRAGLVLASFSLAVVALAQPRYGFIQHEVKQKGRDVIVAVDTSRSMLATDIAPTRLARAKLLTQDLIRLLKGDRVGLVAFAGSAFLQAPLTLDYSAVINALDELDTRVIPKGGTNIAAAIATAAEAFGKAEGQTRALVILTDGEELDADGLAAAKKASQAGIRIFAVGIGSADGSLIPFRSDDGRQDFVRDASGKPVQSRLDDSRLREMAKETGGFYVPISPEAAREIFQQGIEPMELAETGVFASRQPLERYQWPLAFAVAFLVGWLLLGERRRTILPGLRALACLAWLSLSDASHASALQSYQAGDYGEARKAYESHLKSVPESREAEFNAGDSAYMLKDFDQAIAHFSRSLLSEDKKLREDSAYNLGNSLVRRGESAKETSTKKADWKNAIEQYSEALKLDPKNIPAEENRKIVKKLLDDLEKQEEQKKDNKDQKKDQNKDQQNKDQQNKDQQNK